MELKFDEFVLELDQHVLRHGDELLRLEPKVFEVLRHLVLNRERVVTKQELLRVLWPGEHVVDSVVTRCIYALRKTLGQRDPSAPPVATVRGRGYRFTADVQVARATTGEEAAAPLVGREAEVEQLEAALGSARAGRGRLVWLAGDAGIGKTRLAEEIMDRARREGVTPWVARCREIPGAPALSVWTQILRAVLRETERGELARALGSTYSSLGELLPELDLAPNAETGPTASRIEPEAAPYRLFEGVTAVLRLATARAPRLLVIDDVHWADVASLRLLSFLSPEIGSWPLCVVITAREQAWSKDDPRRGSLAAIHRVGHAQRMVLEPLDEAQVARYVRRALTGPDVAAARIVSARSEGNPLFMVELLRAHISGESPLTGTAAPPATVRELTALRVHGLPDETRQALELMAAAGREVPLRLLSAVFDRDSPRMLEALGPALDAHVLELSPDRPGRVRFRHGLLREGLYDSLSLVRRTELHAAIAEALEAAEPTALSEIAHHLVRALPGGEPAHAVDCARRAAAVASSVQAHDEAARLYADALEALEQWPGAPADVRHGVLHGWGRASGLAGRLADATQAFQRAAELARREGEARWLAKDAIGLRDCQPFRAVPDLQVTALLRDALDALPTSEVALRARVLCRLAAVRTVETRAEMSARASTIMADLDDPVARADVLRARLHALQRPTELEERLALADALVALADERAAPSWGWDGQLARYDAYLRLTDVRRADAALEACAEIAERLSHPMLRNEVDRHRAQRALCSGRYADAEARMNRVAQMSERLESPYGRLYYSSQMLWLLRDKGKLHALGDEGERFLVGYPWAEVTSRASLGVLHLERGEIRLAQECLAFYARDGFDSVPDGENHVIIVAQLGELAARLGERRHAEVLYDRLLPHAEQNAVNGPLLYLGSVHAFLGLLSSRLGETAAAIEHLEAAREVNARMGARPALVRTMEALADCVDTNEAKRGASLRREAHELRTTMGMAAPQGAAPLPAGD